MIRLPSFSKMSFSVDCDRFGFLGVPRPSGRGTVRGQSFFLGLFLFPEKGEDDHGEGAFRSHHILFDKGEPIFPNDGQDRNGEEKTKYVEGSIHPNHDAVSPY